VVSRAARPSPWSSVLSPNAALFASPVARALLAGRRRPAGRDTRLDDLFLAVHLTALGLVGALAWLLGGVIRGPVPA